jgi:sulfur carrier protein ThiS
MKVKILLEEGRARAAEAKKGQTISSLLREIGINPQTVIVMKNGEFVTEEETLSEKDTLKIISVK